MDILLEGVAARHPAAKAAAPDALTGLHLSVRAGEHLAVIGPSGAGKTSLLYVLAASLRPTSGQLALGGVNPWQISRRELQLLRGQIFHAPQTPPLPPRQRVVTAVSSARLPDMSLLESGLNLLRPQYVPEVYEALGAFDLGDKLWHRVDRLSGGERQRVGLAKVLVSRARLWLVDEPLSALDPTRAARAIDVLTTEARRRGITLVTSLHQVEVARAMFPRVIGLREGRLQFDLPSADLNETRLQALYAQFENELDDARSGRALADPGLLEAPPVAIACR